jgi:hypothetical protein
LGQMFSNYSNLYLGNQLQNTYNPATLALLGYGGYGQQPYSGGGSGTFPATGGY